MLVLLLYLFNKFEYHLAYCSTSDKMSTLETAKCKQSEQSMDKVVRKKGNEAAVERGGGDETYSHQIEDCCKRTQGATNV